jgi:hypothetical protein
MVVFYFLYFNIYSKKITRFFDQLLYTQVVHNYGHSGSGVTYFWGCAKDVRNLVEEELRESRRIASKLWFKSALPHPRVDRPMNRSKLHLKRTISDSICSNWLPFSSDLTLRWVPFPASFIFLWSRKLSVQRMSIKENKIPTCLYWLRSGHEVLLCRGEDPGDERRLGRTPYTSVARLCGIDEWKMSRMWFKQEGDRKKKINEFLVTHKDAPLAPWATSDQNFTCFSWPRLVACFRVDESRFLTYNLLVSLTQSLFPWTAFHYFPDLHYYLVSELPPESQHVRGGGGIISESIKTPILTNGPTWSPLKGPNSLYDAAYRFVAPRTKEWTSSPRTLDHAQYWIRRLNGIEAVPWGLSASNSLSGGLCTWSTHTRLDYDFNIYEVHHTKLL